MGYVTGSKTIFSLLFSFFYCCFPRPFVVFFVAIFTIKSVFYYIYFYGRISYRSNICKSASYSILKIFFFCNKKRFSLFTIRFALKRFFYLRFALLYKKRQTERFSIGKYIKKQNKDKENLILRTKAKWRPDFLFIIFKAHWLFNNLVCCKGLYLYNMVKIVKDLRSLNVVIFSTTISFFFHH